MTWTDLGEIELEPDWMYFPVPGNLFRFNFPSISDARLTIAFYEEVGEEKFLFGSRVISLTNRLAIFHLDHIYQSSATGFAIKPLFKTIPLFNLEIQQMTLNNVANLTQQPATTITDSTPALTAATALQLLAANANRKYASIVNNSASDVTIQLGPVAGAAVGKGIVLKPGGSSVLIGPATPINWLGAISAISAGAVAAGQLSVSEGV